MSKMLLALFLLLPTPAQANDCDPPKRQAIVQTPAATPVVPATPGGVVVKGRTPSYAHRCRDAETGRWVSDEFARQNPRTTVCERRR